MRSLNEKVAKELIHNKDLQGVVKDCVENIYWYSRNGDENEILISNNDSDSDIDIEKSDIREVTKEYALQYISRPGELEPKPFSIYRLIGLGSAYRSGAPAIVSFEEHVNDYTGEVEYIGDNNVELAMPDDKTAHTNAGNTDAYSLIRNFFEKVYLIYKIVYKSRSQKMSRQSNPESTHFSPANQPGDVNGVYRSMLSTMPDYDTISSVQRVRNLNKNPKEYSKNDRALVRNMASAFDLQRPRIGAKQALEYKANNVKKSLEDTENLITKINTEGGNETKSKNDTRNAYIGTIYDFQDKLLSLEDDIEDAKAEDEKELVDLDTKIAELQDKVDNFKETTWKEFIRTRGGRRNG